MTIILYRITYSYLTKIFTVSYQWKMHVHVFIHLLIYFIGASAVIL